MEDIRAFVKMREDLAANAAILKRLAELTKPSSCTMARSATSTELPPLLEPAAPASETRNRLPCQRGLPAYRVGENPQEMTCSMDDGTSGVRRLAVHY